MGLELTKIQQFTTGIGQFAKSCTTKAVKAAEAIENGANKVKGVLDYFSSKAAQAKAAIQMQNTATQTIKASASAEVSKSEAFEKLFPDFKKELSGIVQNAKNGIKTDYIYAPGSDPALTELHQRALKMAQNLAINSKLSEQEIVDMILSTV